MGWWRTETGGLNGDDAADAATTKLEAMADSRRPRMGELAAALAFVIRAKASDLLAPGETGMIVATVDGERVTPEATVDDDIRNGVDALCNAVSSKYAAHLDRRPTLRELLDSVQFVLGYHPERFVDVVDEAEITFDIDTSS